MSYRYLPDRSQPRSGQVSAPGLTSIPVIESGQFMRVANAIQYPLVLLLQHDSFPSPPCPFLTSL